MPQSYYITVQMAAIFNEFSINQYLLYIFSGSSSFKDDPRMDPLIMKRKRGRPRILDAPGEINPFAQTRISIEVHNAIL